MSIFNAIESNISVANCKLLRALATLQSTEKRRLLAFAASPYHNERPEIQRLLEQLLRFLDNYDPHSREEIGLSRSALTRGIFVQAETGNKTNIPARALPDLLGQAMKLLEAFWCAERSVATPLDRELDVLESLLDRHLDRDFPGRLRKIRRRLAAETRLDAKHYRRMARMESLADAHFARAAERKTHESLRRRIEALDAAYRSEKLREACEVLNRARILQETTEVPGLDDLEQALYTKAADLPPVVAVWYRVLQLLRNPDSTDSFPALREALEQHAEAMSPDERRAVWAYAQNHCIRQANTGAGGWLEPLLDLYRTGLERGILLDGQELPQSTYKNIVTAGLRARAFDWTREFLETYTERLSPAVRANAHAYNMANYHYAVGEWDRAQELLRDVEFADLFYDLGAKTMLLKIYYDQGAYEPLQSLVAAFRAYLRRNRLLGDAQRQAYRNLVALTESLARIRQRRDYIPREQHRKAFAAWQARLEDGRPVMNAAWIRERGKALTVTGSA